jgi:hypothetical protein
LDSSTLSALLWSISIANHANLIENNQACFWSSCYKHYQDTIPSLWELYPQDFVSLNLLFNAARQAEWIGDEMAPVPLDCSKLIIGYVGQLGVNTLYSLPEVIYPKTCRNFVMEIYKYETGFQFDNTPQETKECILSPVSAAQLFNYGYQNQGLCQTQWRKYHQKVQNRRVKLDAKRAANVARREAPDYNSDDVNEDVHDEDYDNVSDCDEEITDNGYSEPTREEVIDLYQTWKKSELVGNATYTYYSQRLLFCYQCIHLGGNGFGGVLDH